MSDLINDLLMEDIIDTIDWASDLSEQWIGTTTGRILDSQRENLRSVIRANDLDMARELVVNLAHTCTFAQKELDES